MMGIVEKAGTGTPEDSDDEDDPVSGGAGGVELDAVGEGGGEVVGGGEVGREDAWGGGEVKALAPTVEDDEDRVSPAPLATGSSLFAVVDLQYIS